MKLEELKRTTSIQPQSSPVREPLSPLSSTVATQIAILKTLPQNKPNVTTLGRVRTPACAFQPQMAGENCDNVMRHRIQACNPKAKSLNRTVGSGLAGWRAAYCMRTWGESRKTAVLMV